MQGGGLLLPLLGTQQPPAAKSTPRPALLHLPRRPDGHALGVAGGGLGVVAQVVNNDILSIRQLHRHAGHGLLQRVIRPVDVGIGAGAIVVFGGDSAVESQGIGGVGDIVGQGDLAVFCFVVQFIRLPVHRSGTRHFRHLVGGEVVQNIPGKALLQQLLPDLFILRRVITEVQRRGEALPQKHAQQDGGQQCAQIRPQQHPVGNAHRGGGDGIAGVRQRAEKSGQIPQDQDIHQQEEQHQQRMLGIHDGQCREKDIEDHQRTGGRGGGLLRAGAAGYADHAPPQADVHGQLERHGGVRRRHARLRRQRCQHIAGAAHSQSRQRQPEAPAEGGVLPPQYPEAQHQQGSAHGGEDHVQVQEMQRDGGQPQSPQDIVHGGVPRGDGILRRRKGGRVRKKHVFKIPFILHRNHLPAPDAASVGCGRADPPRRGATGPARRRSGRWAGGTSICDRTAPSHRR